MNRTIQMDARTTAFYKGVATGSDIQEALAELDTDYDSASRYYWLHIGRASVDIDDEHIQEFLQGAALRAPGPEDDES